MHFSLYYHLAPATSIPWKLFWQKPTINSAWESHWKLFFPLTILFLMDAFFPFIFSHGMPSWFSVLFADPSPFNYLLNICVLQGSVLGPLSSLPHIFPWQTHWLPWLQPILHKQQSWVLNYLTSSKLYYLISSVKMTFIRQLKVI